MNQTITLLLSKRIYSRAYIELASDAFRDIAEIDVSENNAYFIYTFKNCTYDAEQTAAEFENYLIDLSNTHSL